jgi:hypothetical protein
MRVLAAERPARPEPTIITGGGVAIFSISFSELSLSLFGVYADIRRQGGASMRSDDGGLIGIR